MGIVYAPSVGLKVGRARVTIALVAANVIAYILTSYEYGFVRIHGRWLLWGAFIPAYLADLHQLYRLLTSMFLHGNFLHIFFNMFFLYSLGRYVEQVLGGKRYLTLYLLSGLAASIFHVAFIPIEGAESFVIPALGASGAISGVLGAYLLLFPGSKLSICFFFYLFPICLTMSAAAYLIFWFAMQVLQGYLQASAGVAVFAHAGGFLAGVALLPYVMDRERHRLVRVLTSSQRVFRYLFLGAGGLRVFSKLILAVTIASLAVGAACSAAAAREVSAPIKVLSVATSYRVRPLDSPLYTPGYGESTVIIRLERQLSISPIPSDSVRILFNRLNVVGIIYDGGSAGRERVVQVSGKYLVSRVPVDVVLNASVRYDESGLLDSAEGVLSTTILSCRGAVCVPFGTGDFKFKIRTTLGMVGGITAAYLLAALSVVSLALCLAALNVILRRAHELGIVV